MAGMVNPLELFKLKALFDQLTAAHPKLVPFVHSVYPNEFAEGTIIDIKVTNPAGKVFHYNMRLSAEDIAAMQEAKTIGQGMASDNDN